MNIIYTVKENEEIVYYAGHSYVVPENKSNHKCNCEHCHFNTKKLRYNFSADYSKACHIETDDEVRMLLDIFGKKEAFGVPLWVRGYRFLTHPVTPMRPKPIIVKHNPEYYRF